MPWRPLALVIPVLALALSPAPAARPQATGASPAAAEARKLQQQGDFDGAAAAWRSVVEANPGHAAGWYNLGYSLHAAGRLEEAVQAHQRAATFDSLAANAGYNLACALALLDRGEEALEALEEAVASGFANVALLRQDRDLDAVRDTDRFRSIVAGIELPLPRLLHFWIGEWDCYSAKSGQLNGRNDLVARLGDKVIHEIWTPVGGGPGGESWNYFDPGSRTWRQQWIDGAGRPFVFVGTPHEGGILYEGPPDVGGESAQNRKRIFIRPIGDGRVQQTGTRSADGGRTWTPRYDLIYVPRGEPFAVGSSGATAADADPARQFDFLIGDWRMEVEQYDAQGQVIRTLTEWSRVRSINDGTSLIDEWKGSGFTVRTWDPKDELWRLFWTDRHGSAGRMQMWEGTFEGGVGTFVGGTILPSAEQRITSKIEFSGITDDSVLLKMWKSPDGGRTWVLDYVRRYARVAG